VRVGKSLTEAFLDATIFNTPDVETWTKAAPIATERVAADATCEAEAPYNKKRGENYVIYMYENTIFLKRKTKFNKN